MSAITRGIGRSRDTYKTRMNDGDQSSQDRNNRPGDYKPRSESFRRDTRADSRSTWKSSRPGGRESDNRRTTSYSDNRSSSSNFGRSSDRKGRDSDANSARPYSNDKSVSTYPGRSSGGFNRNSDARSYSNRKYPSSKDSDQPFRSKHEDREYGTPDEKRGFRAERGYQKSERPADRSTNSSGASPWSNQQLRMNTPGDEAPAESSYSSGRSWSDTADSRPTRRASAIQDGEYFSSRTGNHFKIPLTTAASEFIYGRSSVLAALKSGRRQCYKLYLSRSDDDRNADSSKALYQYALRNNTEVIQMDESDKIAAMDRISKGRPHNGVILEASPLPKLPVSALGEARKGKSFDVVVRHQSEEEEKVNGSDAQIAMDSTHTRYPFVVMLHEVIDTGNLGGILRSAYFLGADAVVLSSNNASLNAVALKAASGAAEGIQLLSVHNTTGFLQASQDNGWDIYASVAPPATNSAYQSKHMDLNHLGHPLQDGPCLLLLGGEGEGLRRDLVTKADHTVSITGQRSNQEAVDSLNVSVAAGILMEAFLREPPNQKLDLQDSEGSELSFKSNLLF